MVAESWILEAFNEVFADQANALSFGYRIDGINLPMAKAACFSAAVVIIVEVAPKAYGIFTGP